MNDDLSTRQALASLHCTGPGCQCSVCSSLILCCELSWGAGELGCTRDHQHSQLSFSHQPVPPLSLSTLPPSLSLVCYDTPSTVQYISVISLPSSSCHPWHIHDITPPLWRQHTMAPGWRCCFEASLPELGLSGRWEEPGCWLERRGAQH